MADRLRQVGIRPELALCSPSRRTRETLERIAPSLGKSAEVRIEPRIYTASPATLLEELREVPDEVESVMLIGLNLGIQGLALSLVRPSPESGRVESKFPTAALAHRSQGRRSCPAGGGR